MPSPQEAAAHRKKLRDARNALRRLTSRLPQEDEAYQLLLGLGDETISDAAADRQVILSGTAMLEQILKDAITLHFRYDIDEPENNRIFVGNQDNFGVLSTFHSRIVIARALGILSEEAAEDFQTLQAIRNHFAHSPLVFRFDEAEILSLISLLYKTPENDSGIEHIRDILGNRGFIIYLITNYYFSLQTYSHLSL
jgi:hypothetical protein